MSLGLVAYDDSDDSETEIDSGGDHKSRPNVSLTQNKNVVPLSPSVAKPLVEVKEEYNKPAEISDEEPESSEDTEKSSKLHIPQSRVNLLNTDIDIKCLTSANKRNGPVKITIPSLNEIEDDAEQPSKKKLKPSQKGSGLFALLPNPKSAIVPQSVVNRKQNLATNKQSTLTSKTLKPVPKARVKTTSLINYEDSGDEDESSATDFFSLIKKDKVLPEPVVEDVDLSAPEVNQPEPELVTPDTSDGALQFNLSFQPPSTWQAGSSREPSHSATHQPPSEYPTNEFMTFSNNALELDQEAMQQLCGRKDRLKMQEVSLIDVSGDAIMPDTREWLTKQMTEEQAHRPSHKKRDGPTSQQKRKHQITYLAYQAKENELELKNQWSNNRVSRKQTQAKYGF